MVVATFLDLDLDSGLRFGKNKNRSRSLEDRENRIGNAISSSSTAEIARCCCFLFKRFAPQAVYHEPCVPTLLYPDRIPIGEALPRDGSCKCVMCHVVFLQLVTAYIPAVRYLVYNAWPDLLLLLFKEMFNETTGSKK